MNAVAIGCLVVLAASLLLVVAFLLRARGLADRSLGLDTMMSIVLNGLAVVIVVTSDSDVVDLMLLVAALAFFGTVTIARFVERRGNTVHGEED